MVGKRELGPECSKGAGDDVPGETTTISKVTWKLILRASPGPKSSTCRRLALKPMNNLPRGPGALAHQGAKF